MNRYLEDSVFISSDEDSTFESENSRDSSTATSNSSNSLISAEESETNLTPESSDLSMDNTDFPGPSTRSAYNRVVIDLEASQRPTTSALPVNRMNRIEMNESGDDDVQVVQDHRGGIPVIHSPDRSIVLLNSSTDPTFVAPSINTRSRARIIPEDAPTLDQGVIPQDFRKRKSSGEIQPSTSNCFPALDETLEDGDLTCTICFEEYTASGDHRLVCLKCGHLFGKKCIEKWIRAEKNAKCPQCQIRAKIGDIRIIFGKKIKMIDNYEVEQLKEANANLKMEKETLSLRLTRMEQKVKEMEEVTKQNAIKQVTSSSISSLADAPLHSILRPRSLDRFFTLVKSFLPIEVSEPGGARFMDFHKDFGLVIACKLPNTPLNMNYNFGLRKMSIETDAFNIKNTVPSHKSRIRCCAISPFNPNLVLSVGEDKNLCVTSFEPGQLKVLSRIELPAIGWSCTWMNSDRVAVGHNDGSVIQFQWGTTEPPKTLMEKSGRGPVFRLEWVAEKNYLFIVTLKECLIWRFGEKTSLFMDAIQSFAYDPVSDNFCVTIRPPTVSDEPVPEAFIDPNGRCVPVHRRHTLNLDNGPVCVNHEIYHSKSHTFVRLVQNTLYSTPNISDPMMLVYYSESTSQIVVEDMRKSRSTLVVSVPHMEKIQQLKVIPMLNGPKNEETGLHTYLYILALADTKLYIHKFKY